MISAAPARSLRVLRMRDRSLSCAVCPVAAISGIIDTPVSNPDRPRTRSGNAMTAASIAPPRPPTSDTADIHVDNAPSVVNTSTRPRMTTTALRRRNAATSGIATVTASLKPSRNTPPSRSRKNTVMATACPCSASGMRGDSSRCTDASAADKVMVMIHDVATKPRRTRTNTLPRQNGRRSSSMATDPCPWGLSLATREYMGSMPSRVSRTMSRVASGDSAPAASAAMPGRYARVEK